MCWVACLSFLLEMTARNILIFCVISFAVFRLSHGGISLDALCGVYSVRIHSTSWVRHGISIVVAAVVAFLTYRVSLNLWFKNAFPHYGWLPLSCCLLYWWWVLEVNGAHRWIKVGSFTLQPTEIAKIVMAIFRCSYVVRRAKEVRTHWKGLLRLKWCHGIDSWLHCCWAWLRCNSRDCPDDGGGVFPCRCASCASSLIMLGAIVAGCDGTDPVRAFVFNAWFHLPIPGLIHWVLATRFPMH